MNFWRTSACGALLAGLLGCSGMSGIPIVGMFAPNPANDMIRQSQANQRDAMLNYTFRPGWKNLIDDHKYKAALAYIDAHKAEIGEVNEKTFIDDTNREGKNYIVNVLTRFRRTLQELKSQKDLAAMKADEFAAAFTIPPPDEQVHTPPAYEWARASSPAFEDFRTRKPSGEGLMKALGESAALPADDDGEYRWFEAMESLLFTSMGDAVRTDVEKSQDAPKAAREQAKSRVDALHAKWTLMYESIDKNFKLRSRVADHDLELGKLAAGVPKDLTDLDKIDLSACMASGSPEAELQKAERDLKVLEGRAGITRESRQRLYTLIVTAAALRGFLQGKEESEVVAEVKAYGEKLAKVGGPTDTRAFGARVQSVFDALLR